MKPDFADMVNRSGGNISETDAEVLYDTAMQIKAQNILEIGSREGGSTMVLASVAKLTDGTLHCIEPEIPLKWAENIRHYKLGEYLYPHQAKNPWVSGLYEIFKDIEGGIDYLFLDGGGSKNQPHHTRWMLVDYHYWEPLIRIGGRVAFHDWTGKNGVAEQVRRAVAIILETDDLREVCRHESTDRGIIVFEKRG